MAEVHWNITISSSWSESGFVAARILSSQGAALSAKVRFACLLSLCVSGCPVCWRAEPPLPCCDIGNAKLLPWMLPCVTAAGIEATWAVGGQLRPGKAPTFYLSYPELHLSWHVGNPSRLQLVSALCRMLLNAAGAAGHFTSMHQSQEEGGGAWNTRVLWGRDTGGALSFPQGRWVTAVLCRIAQEESQLLSCC